MGLNKNLKLHCKLIKNNSTVKMNTGIYMRYGTCWTTTVKKGCFGIMIKKKCLQNECRKDRLSVLEKKYGSFFFFDTLPKFGVCSLFYEGPRQSIPNVSTFVFLLFILFVLDEHTLLTMTLWRHQQMQWGRTHTTLQSINTSMRNAWFCSAAPGGCTAAFLCQPPLPILVHRGLPSSLLY